MTPQRQAQSTTTADQLLEAEIRARIDELTTERNRIDARLADLRSALEQHTKNKQSQQPIADVIDQALSKLTWRDSRDKPHMQYIPPEYVPTEVKKALESSQGKIETSSHSVYLTQRGWLQRWPKSKKKEQEAAPVH